MNGPVLVIDDDLDSFVAVTRLLPRTAEAQAAESVEEGLSLARTTRPSCIVLSADLKAGYAACRRIKKDDRYQGIPVILASVTVSDQFEAHQKLPTAADAYLQKPFDGHELATALARLTGLALEIPAPIARPEPEPPPPLVDTASMTEGDVSTKDGTAGLAADKGRIAELEAELAKSKALELQLERRVTELTERVANMKTAQRRLEEARQIERERGKVQLADARSAAEDASADAAEMATSGEDLNRLRHENVDLREAMLAIAEALQTPLELVQQYQETYGEPAAAAERAPLALGAD